MEITLDNGLPNQIDVNHRGVIRQITCKKVDDKLLNMYYI